MEDCDLEICSHEFYPVDAFQKAVANTCDVRCTAKIGSDRWSAVFNNRITDSGVFNRLVKPREYPNLYLTKTFEMLRNITVA